MEPMTLGSPVNSPGSNQNQYLPPFLMGDPQNMTPHKNTLSPKPGRYNVSFATSPGGSNSQDFNRSTYNNRTLFGSGGGGPNASAAAVSANTSMAAAAHAHAHTLSHQAGPPTQGLFDSLRENTASTPQRNHLSLLNLQSPNQSMGPNQSYQSYQTNDSFAPAAPVNASMRALYSPLGATASPGPGLVATPGPTGADLAAAFWVTIFGFAPGANSMVLQHFTLCGTIVDVVHAPQNGNWMHVRFSSRIESDKALNYNHKVIAGNVMVGVTRCTDRSVIDKENSSSVANSESISGPPSTPKIRPFAQQGYKLAQNESTVSPPRDVPQRSSGLVNKAMDLIFGW
ncbi:uncharacterized protein Dana_GF22540 [Drosophila ananassae]|uniref:Nucleoporin NUP53 n=1 Tax=Drosophila ananassae TaxID=7217 RepID=B3MVP9_DROAN|nr:nucleoporin Nup35 [Drosophila ananassae]EDV35044.1 uncharacterized protein Dana_GF22540 [Drosophila ananassae]